MKFQWTHHPQKCIKCLECVDTCRALTLSNLKRIIRNKDLCTRCETCSEICDNITTEFLTQKGDPK